MLTFENNRISGFGLLNTKTLSSSTNANGIRMPKIGMFHQRLTLK